MKYAEAIATLKASEIEGIGEILEAITKETQDLERYKKQRDELDSLLNAALQGFGNENDSLDKRLKALSTELESTKSSLTATEQAKAEAEGKLKAYQRKELVQSAAQKTGANFEAFNRLLKAEDEVKIAGDLVTINGISFKDWADSEAIKPFAPALIPQSEETPKSPKPSLPTGSPQGQQAATPLAKIFSKYSIPDHLKAD